MIIYYSTALASTTKMSLVPSQVHRKYDTAVKKDTAADLRCSLPNFCEVKHGGAK